jgi:Mg2+-importing ATPase
MIVFGLVSSVFDFLTFALLIYFIRASETEFQTGWFIESLLTELLVALVVRTRRPFYKSRPGRWLWISTVTVTAFALAVPYIPYASIFGFVPLPPGLMALIVGIALVYAVSTEAAKRIFYIRMRA